MIGNIIRCKYPYSFNNIGKNIYETFDVIQLTKPHEAGEIINDYLLIATKTVFLLNEDEEIQNKYKIGEYVKVIDIRYFDIFETDFDYDNRKDLKKVGTRSLQYGCYNIVDTNLYKYIGTDYPKDF